MVNSTTQLHHSPPVPPKNKWRYFIKSLDLGFHWSQAERTVQNCVLGFLNMQCTGRSKLLLSTGELGSPTRLLWYRRHRRIRRGSSHTQFPSPLSPPAAAGPAQLSAQGQCSCLQAICRHRLMLLRGAAGTAQEVTSILSRPCNNANTTG